MAADPYRDFSRVYDDWQRLYPQPFSLALAPLIRSAVIRRGSPRPVLADLACGTGTFALWWKRTHPAWRVYGSDLSPGMIRRAKAEGGTAERALRGPAKRSESGRSASPNGRGSSVRFFVQDLRDLALPEPAGVLTCLFDSLNHVTRVADLARIFRRVHNALAPGGLFLFDLVAEDAFPEVFTGDSILEDKNLYVGIETKYTPDRRGDTGRARFTFFRKTGSHWKRTEFHIRERRWTSRQVRALLSAAGLKLERSVRLDALNSEEFFVPRTFWVCSRGK